jgi:two-component system alkaline phosphatase synthesis response regulator PhoP
LSNIYIMAEDSSQASELCASLIGIGYACAIVLGEAELASATDVDLVLLENASYARIGELSRIIKRERNLPIIALVHDTPAGADAQLDSVDDFAVKPWDIKELDLRIKRLLRRTSKASEVVGCGDLVIDLAGYQVFLGGRPVELTFKEYELLRFLVTNRDRVFTREALLNKVWGYDYFGGDRTVDVHIQRLRTKIESSENVCIETVRNIGYRLKTDKC